MCIIFGGKNFQNLIFNQFFSKYSTFISIKKIKSEIIGERALNLHQCFRTCLQARGSKRLSYHADLYTVSRCRTRGESEDHTSKKARKGSTLALKLRVDITRSPKQGYQWPHQKFILKKVGE